MTATVNSNYHENLSLEGPNQIPEEHNHIGEPSVEKTSEIVKESLGKVEAGPEKIELSRLKFTKNSKLQSEKDKYKILDAALVGYFDLWEPIPYINESFPLINSS